MMKDVRITKDNDFTLFVEAYNKEGEEETPQDLRLVDNLAVTIPYAPDGSYTWSVDDSGRLVLDIDGTQLSVRPYGMEAKGTIEGRDWCWRVRRLFEVVKYTDDCNSHTSIRLCTYCAVGGMTVMPVKTVTLSQFADMALMPSTLYLVTDDGDGIPRRQLPLGGSNVYTIEEQTDR